MFVEFSRPYISHAEEWEVRISRGNGGRKGWRGNDETG